MLVRRYTRTIGDTYSFCPKDQLGRYTSAVPCALICSLVGLSPPNFWWLARVIIVPRAFAGNVALFPEWEIVAYRGIKACISRMQVFLRRSG